MPASDLGSGRSRGRRHRVCRSFDRRCPKEDTTSEAERRPLSGEHAQPASRRKRCRTSGGSGLRWRQASSRWYRGCADVRNHGRKRYYTIDCKARRSVAALSSSARASFASSAGMRTFVTPSRPTQDGNDNVTPNLC